MIRYRGVVEGLERSDREIEEELFDEDNTLENKMTRDHHLSLHHQKAQEPSIIQRRSLGVGLEEWGVVVTLTIFGNLGVFFVSFLLLYHCFVILIKYSRAQRGKRLSPPIISPFVALELKGYLSDLRISFVFAL